MHRQASQTARAFVRRLPRLGSARTSLGPSEPFKARYHVLHRVTPRNIRNVVLDRRTSSRHPLSFQ
jgi:hypothetical protein